MWKNIKHAFFVIFHPPYWQMNNPYSFLWDAKLNKLMAEHHFTDIGSHTAMLGEYEIWIANHPYASFVPYGARFGRPSRKTIRAATKKILSDYLTAA